MLNYLYESCSTPMIARSKTQQVEHKYSDVLNSPCRRIADDILATPMGKIIIGICILRIHSRVEYPCPSSFLMVSITVRIGINNWVQIRKRLRYLDFGHVFQRHTGLFIWSMVNKSDRIRRTIPKHSASEFDLCCLIFP